jgi:hypothetical protein
LLLTEVGAYFSARNADVERARLNILIHKTLGGDNRAAANTNTEQLSGL